MPIKLDEQPGGVCAAKPIVFGEIKKMTDHYRESAGAKDPKSAWVSREEINALLDQNKGDGIRIYFGRYTEDVPDFGGWMTVILVATKLKEGPDDPATRCKRSKSLLKEVKEGDDEANSLIATLFVKVDNGYQGMGDNAIPLCPDHCPDDDIKSGLDR